MLRRLVALLVTLAVVHVSVASALEQCAAHAPAHCQSSKSHEQAPGQQAPGQQVPGRQAPGQHHASDCCPLGGTCAPWAMTVALAPQVRVSHAMPAGVEPGRVFNLRLPPEPPPPRA